MSTLETDPAIIALLDFLEEKDKVKGNKYTRGIRGKYRKAAKLAEIERELTIKANEAVKRIRLERTKATFKRSVNNIITRNKNKGLLKDIVNSKYRKVDYGKIESATKANKNKLIKQITVNNNNDDWYSYDDWLLYKIPKLPTATPTQKVSISVRFRTARMGKYDVGYDQGIKDYTKLKDYNPTYGKKETFKEDNRPLRDLFYDNTIFLQVVSYDYITFTVEVSYNEVRAKVEDQFKTVFELPYIINADIWLPIKINIVSDKPTPILQLPLRNTVLDRSSQGLEDISKDKEPGQCMIDLFYNHCKDYKKKSGQKSYYITRQTIIDAFGPCDFTGEDAIRVAKALNFAGIVIYFGAQLHLCEKFNKPLVNETFNKQPSKSTIPILSVVIVDGHIYKHNIKLETGRDRLSCKVGVDDFSDKSFCIIRPTTIEELDFRDHAAQDFRDHAAQGSQAPIVYVASAENLINMYFRQQLQEKLKLISVVAMNHKDLSITKAEINGKLYIYAPDVDKSLKLINLYNENSKRNTIKYSGQSFHSLLLQYANYYFNIKPHITNPQVFEIMNSPFAKNYGTMGWVVAEKLRKDCSYADVRQCYQSCLREYEYMELGPNDEFTDYKGEDICEWAYYYLCDAPQLRECLLFQGPGVYYGKQVLRGLNDGIIKKLDISKVLKGTKSKSKWSDLLDFVNVHFESPNLDINKMLGVMQSGMTTDKQNIFYTTSWADVEAFKLSHEEPTTPNMSKIALSKALLTRRDYKIEFIDFKKAVTKEITRELKNGEHGLYSVSGAIRIPNIENYQATHIMITNLMHLKIYDHCCAIAAFNKCIWQDITYGFYVDSIAFAPKTIFPPEVKQNKSEAIGGQLVRCEPFKTQVTATVRERYILFDDEPNPLFNLSPWERKKSEHIRYYELPPSLQMVNPFEPHTPDRVKGNDIFETFANDIRELTGEGNIKTDDVETMISGDLAIIAKAGHGKSTVLGKIAKHLITNNIPFEAISYTHATVLNLNRMIGQEKAHTTASFLGLSRDNGKDEALISEGKKPIYCKWTKTPHYIIIDEFGTTPQRAWAKIWNKKMQFGTKLLMAADPGQMAPIGENLPINPYRSLIKKMCGNRYLSLTTNWRAREDPAYAKALDDIYKGLPVNVSIFGTNETNLNIVATNKLRNMINEIRSWQNAPDKKYKHPLVPFRVFVGMPVICDNQLIGDNLKIENAYIFTIRYITEATITIAGENWDNTETITDIPAKLFGSHFLPRYAITADKAQGQTFPNPHTIYQHTHFLAERWGWRYVAFSRGTKRENVNIGDERAIIAQYEKLLLTPGFTISQPKDYRKGYIYIIKQFGECVYVGQTWNIEERREQHKAATTNTPLSMNIKNFGWDSFTMDIIYEEMLNQSMLNAKEDEYIKLYDPPYNQLSASSK